MINFQTLAAILFILLMIFFILRNRKRIYLQKIAFPFLYFVMYKTKLGINFMEKMSKKFPRMLKWTAYAGIFIGFLGMAFISYSLIYNLIIMLVSPVATAGVALVLPFKVKGSFYVPFFYWIISIFVLAVIHEFSHGVMARVYGIKIKSSGFAFLGILVPILPAAFVEPDENEMKKKSRVAKLSVLAAGPFSNILFAVLVALLLTFVLLPAESNILEYDGIQVKGYIMGVDNMTYPAEQANMTMGDIITSINGVQVLEVENFTAVLETTNPGQEIVIETNATKYTITLAEDPQNINKSYLGVYVRQSSKINEVFRQKYGSILTLSLIWIFGLFKWFYVLNLGIGLFNLVPIGPIDGGRMVLVVLTKYLREDIAIKVWKFISIIFFLIILASIAFAFVK